MIHKLKMLVFLMMLGSYALAQNVTVRGSVTEEQGQPLPGVTIVVKGTSIGTSTDFDGNYSLVIKEGSEIVFSFIGYVEKTFVVTKNQTIDVQMELNSEIVDEVVIVGYGTQKKESVVGSIATAKGEDLKSQGNISNVTDALAGAMPGVTVLTSTGLPGGGGSDEYEATEILVRGKATWNNSSPLVLVDGIERSMTDIDISEIESFSVLKDASATAVFGVKGGNGVILITTKRGNIGKAKLSIEANMTFEDISKIAEVVDSYSGLQARNYAIMNEVPVNAISWSDYTPDEILEYYKTGEYPYAYPSVDWQDEMLKDYAKSYRINLSASGGTDFVKYFTSLSYNHVGDIMATSDYGQGYNPSFGYDRFNVRSNLDFNITNTTKLKVNLSGLFGVQQKSGGSYHSIWYGLYSHTPNAPIIQYEDGTYGYTIISEERVWENEFVNVNFSGYDKSNRTEVNSDFTLEQDLKMLTKGLKFSARIGYDNYFVTTGGNINDEGVILKYIDPEFYLLGGYYDYDQEKYMLNGEAADMDEWTTYQYPGAYDGDNGFNYVKNPLEYTAETISSNNAGQVKRNLYYEMRFQYDRAFGDHNVGAMALFSRQERQTGSNWPVKREDWVGRVTYNYKSKYLFEANGAYNGSQKFGPGYKFDFFPSVAVGWTISNEDFFSENVKFIELLKIRYSDGIVGNDNVNTGGSQWPFLTIWESGNYYGEGQEKFGDQVPVTSPYQKYYPGTPGNADLQWETAHKRNLGIEVNAMDNSIAFTADLFHENRTDMLVAASQRSVPDTYGTTPPAANIGEVTSQGAEFELTLRNHHENTLSYWASGNLTIATNEVIYKEDPQLKPDYQKQAGYSIGQVRSRLSDGIISSWDDMYTGVVDYSANDMYLPGDYRFVDFNSNGEIDPDDAAPYGYSVYPQKTYGFSFGASYKGVELSLQFYGITDVTRNVTLSTFSFNSAIMYQELIDDTSTPEYNNANPTYPSLNYLRSNYSTAEYANYDGSLLRLKTAEVAYTLPNKLTERVNISKMRFYLNANNPIVWTDMPIDGEGSNFGIKNYPVKKQVTVGLNVQF